MIVPIASVELGMEAPPAESLAQEQTARVFIVKVVLLQKSVIQAAEAQIARHLERKLALGLTRDVRGRGLVSFRLVSSRRILR
jgi:hypothetical protein